MSILTAPIESESQRTAREVIQSIQETKGVILGQLRHTIKTLFGSSDPQAVLDLFGPRGAELISLNQKLTEFVQTLLTDAGDLEGLQELQSIIEKIPELVINQDGSVTIQIPVEDTPEEQA